MSFQTTISVCSGFVSEEFKSVLCEWHHLRSKRNLKGDIWGSTPVVFDASLYRKWTKSCDSCVCGFFSEKAADHHLLNEKVWAVCQPTIFTLTPRLAEGAGGRRVLWSHHENIHGQVPITLVWWKESLTVSTRVTLVSIWSWLCWF